MSKSVTNQVMNLARMAEYCLKQKEVHMARQDYETAAKYRDFYDSLIGLINHVTVVRDVDKVASVTQYKIETTEITIDP